MNKAPQGTDPEALRSSSSCRAAYFSAMNGYSKLWGGAKVYLLVRGLIQRTMFRIAPVKIVVIGS
jgi:hypothetical protein